MDSGSIFNFKASAKKRSEMKYVAFSFLHGKQARWMGAGRGVPHGYCFHTEKVRDSVRLLRAFLPPTMAAVKRSINSANIEVREFLNPTFICLSVLGPEGGHSL